MLQIYKDLIDTLLFFIYRVSGYLLNKVGKSAALAVGSSVILIQVAMNYKNI